MEAPGAANAGHELRLACRQGRRRTTRECPVTKKDAAKTKRVWGGGKCSKATARGRGAGAPREHERLLNYHGGLYDEQGAGAAIFAPRRRSSVNPSYVHARAAAHRWQTDPWVDWSQA